MKSPLFFAKLPAAAFFLFTGMQPAAAQRVPDGGQRIFCPMHCRVWSKGAGDQQFHPRWCWPWLIAKYARRCV